MQSKSFEPVVIANFYVEKTLYHIESAYLLDRRFESLSYFCGGIFRFLFRQPHIRKAYEGEIPFKIRVSRFEFNGLCIYCFAVKTGNCISNARFNVRYQLHAAKIFKCRYCKNGNNGK